MLLVPMSASAFSVAEAPFSTANVKWPPPYHITYRLNPAGSDNINDGSDLLAIHESFADWADLECANLSVELLGDTGDHNLLTGADSNGDNDVTWVETSAWQFGSYVLGVTAPLYNFNGTIVEADIALNGYLQQWSTQGGWNKLDVKGIAVHEVGHLFGVQHNLSGWPVSNPPTMAPAWDGTLKAQTLENDDQRAVCFLYPASGTYSCTQDDHCPYVLSTHEVSGNEYYSAKYTCSDGSCSLETEGSGSQPLGGFCNSSLQCQGDLFCQPLSAGGAICTHLCTPGNPNTCESGFSCVSYPGGGGGACVQGNDSEKGNGEACDSSDECKTGLCTIHPIEGEPHCQPPCDTGDGSDDCPSGSLCVGLPGATGPQGACWPIEDLGGINKFDDEPCDASFQCKSGLCVLDAEQNQGFCRAPCDPALDNCSASTWCMTLSEEGIGACVPGDGPPPAILAENGGICELDEQCASAHCFQPLGANVAQCVDFCILPEAVGCNAGMACVGYGAADVGVCMPEKTPTGEACENSSECTSQVCMLNATTGEGMCSQPCWDEGACPCELSCMEVTTVGAVCLPDPTALPCELVGVECEDHIDCHGGQCVNGGCAPGDPPTSEAEGGTGEETASGESGGGLQGPTNPGGGSGGGCTTARTHGAPLWVFSLFLALGLPALRSRQDRLRRPGDPARETN